MEWKGTSQLFNLLITASVKLISGIIFQLKSQPRVMFRSVMVEAKVKQDLDIANELASHIGQATGDMSSATRAAASGCLLDVLCKFHKP